MKIAVTDSIFPNLNPVEELAKSIDAEVELAKEPTVEAILEVARDADGVLATFAQVPAEVIDNLEKCRVIGRFGIGVDNIDIEAASKKGIMVTRVPDYCWDEVSDHAMALMLACARKISFSDKLVKAGRWEMPATVPIYRLRGQTVGLFGFGNIPQLVAPKAQAFGMDVIAHDPYVKPEVAKEKGVEMVDFDEILERSDFISIHAPLTEETRHIFNSDAFKKMKKTAYLINTARGPLVNTDDLDKALDAEEIAGAGLDVLPEEPPKDNDPVVGRDNVVLSPHTGFYSEEALTELQTKAATDVVAVLKGEEPQYPVNADKIK